MPEMVTKYPEVALEILKDAKIKCGVGAKQQILTDCPKEDFCALPTGEICVYGVKDISNTTQIDGLDLLFSSKMMLSAFPFLFLVFACGILTGLYFGRK